MLFASMIISGFLQTGSPVLDRDCLYSPVLRSGAVTKHSHAVISPDATK